METKLNPTETEATLRRVGPAAPTDALRERAIARAREAWRETPAVVGRWRHLTFCAPWLAAAAVLALGLFVNSLLVSSGSPRPEGATALAPGRSEGQDGLPGALAEWRCFTFPEPGMALDEWLRESRTDRDELLPEKPPASPPPPTPPPQAEGRRGGTDEIAGAARQPGWIASCETRPQPREGAEQCG
jgi:hypothetical protein